MDNNIKNKQKHYVSSIDKELEYFKKNLTRVRQLKPMKISSDILVDHDSKIIDNSLNISSQNKPSKKPVVIINSFPKVSPLPPKKPVVIIKKNISNIDNNKEKQTFVKKPVVSIIPQKEFDKIRNSKDNQTDYKLNTDFDLPPTQEQIDHSSVYIIPKNNKSSAWNKQVDNQINKLNEKPFLLFHNDSDVQQEKEVEHKRDFFHSKPVSSVFIRPFNSNQNLDNDYQDIESDYQIDDYDSPITQEEIIVEEEYVDNYNNEQTQELDDYNLIDDIQEVEYNDSKQEKYINKNNVPSIKEQLEGLNKSTQLVPIIKKYDFESLILDSIDKQISTSMFKAKILKKLNLSIYFGDVLLIYSPASGGKTTLLNIISKKEHFDKGEYLINDKQHVELSASQINDFINKSLFYIHRAISLNSQDTIYSHLKSTYKKFNEEFNYSFTLEDIIEKFNIGNLVNKTFNIINDIEKNTILIVYAIISNKQIILIDEPYLPENQQDDYLVKNVIRLANNVYNKTIVIASKNKRLFDVATRIYFLNKGTLKQIN